MRCRAKGCTTQIPDSTTSLLCEACLVELDVLLRDALEQRIGHAPSPAEMSIFLDRVLASCTKGDTHGR